MLSLCNGFYLIRALIKIKTCTVQPRDYLLDLTIAKTVHYVRVRVYTSISVANNKYCDCYARPMAPSDTEELSPLVFTQHSLEFSVEHKPEWREERKP